MKPPYRPLFFFCLGRGDVGGAGLFDIVKGRRNPRPIAERGFFLFGLRLLTFTTDLRYNHNRSPRPATLMMDDPGFRPGCSQLFERQVYKGDK
jgi:hypothetical protein